MKSYRSIPLFIAVILLMAFEAKSQDKQEKAVVLLIESDAFSKGLTENPDIQLIDIRTPEEYNEGHLKNSKLINFYDADFKQQITSLDKNMPVYFYCKSGGRSAKASKIFQEEGFKNIIELKDGITGWQNAGKEVVK